MKPPADLASRTLPLDTLEAGSHLYRIHATDREPLFFGPPASDRPLAGRWDAPDRAFGVCYFADERHPYVAFAERFLREPGRTLIAGAALRHASFATLRLTRQLRVVRFSGNGLARLGATAEVAHGDHRIGRPRSLELHGHPASPAGIRSRARHDDEGFAVALFERARDALELVGSVPLLSPELADDLEGWLERYGVGVED